MRMEAKMRKVCVSTALLLAICPSEVAAQVRSMGVTGSPQLGLSVVFEHRAPAGAAGALAMHLLTPHYSGIYPLQIPGFVMVGAAHVDVAQIWLQTSSLLSPAGASAWAVQIPFDASFLGVTFDVQSLDLDLNALVLNWSQSDAELAIGAFAPPSNLEMVAVSAGSFSMGTTIVGPWSQPVHAVAITRPFWIGKHEVTQAQYQALSGINPSSFQGASYPDAARRPVENVSWLSAMAYCATLTAVESAAGRIPVGYQYRLPTEAEWEYCCRAGTATEYSLGATVSCAQVNYQQCTGETRAVGSYAANPWGLHDMHGNVWEWCLDAWDGSANYPSTAVADPYSTVGQARIIRGGSWINTPDLCLSGLRGSYAVGLQNLTLGFRVVLAPQLVP